MAIFFGIIGVMAFLLIIVTCLLILWTSWRRKSRSTVPPIVTQEPETDTRTTHDDQYQFRQTPAVIYSAEFTSISIINSEDLPPSYDQVTSANNASPK